MAGAAQAAWRSSPAVNTKPAPRPVRWKVTSCPNFTRKLRLVNQLFQWNAFIAPTVTWITWIACVTIPPTSFALSECDNLIAIMDFQPQRIEEIKQRCKQGRVELVNATFSSR